MDPMKEIPAPSADGASGEVWSWLCAGCALQRGLSYLLRPPTVNTRTENVIEHFVSYTAWGWIVLAVAISVAAGLVMGWRLLELAGHIVGSAVYVLLGGSVILSALWLGQPWAPSGALLFIAAMHMARVKQVARRLGSKERR
jgi:hypothetical protein